MKKRLFTQINNEYNIDRVSSRGVLSEIHISDIHFGAIDPKTEYNILKEQFINELYRIPIIDIIFINGDLFERKYTTDSEPIAYALRFMEDIRLVAINKNATVVIISGTESHDAGQLNLLYHYMEDPLYDIRIVENIRFEYIKGAQILCIPELYGIDEEIYEHFLFKSGIYDQCVMHGTIEGAVYNNTINKRGRLFNIYDFNNCRGPVVAGHVHIAGCYNKHFYYTGSPIRYKFGEEEEKGFILIYYNLDTSDYYHHLIPIKSFRYDTIDLEDILSNDPKDIITYIDSLKDDNVDYLRIKYGEEVSEDNIAIVREYYKNSGKIKMISDKKKRKEDAIVSDVITDNKYNYLLDNTLSPYEKLALYINDREKCEFISGDEIKKLVEEE